jgi:hypothetical protein
MLNRWPILSLLAACSPVALSAQNVVQLSDPDSLVTVATWRQACGVETHRARFATAEADTVRAALALRRALAARIDTADAAAELAQAREDLERMMPADSALRAVPDSTSLALKWLCTFKDPRAPIPGSARIPSRTEVMDAAEAVRNVPEIRDRSLSAPAFSAVFGVSEAKIVSGLTTLVVRRAEAEFQIAVINRIDEQVCDSSAVLRPLFSASCSVISQDGLKLRKALLRELHTALRTDLKSVPSTGPLALVRSSRFPKTPCPVASANNSDTKASAAAFTSSQQDLIMSAYVLGTTVKGVLDGLPPVGALTRTLTTDPTEVDATISRGLLEDVLDLCNSGRIELPATAVLQRLALTGLMLPDDDGNGVGDWPAADNSDGRLEIMRTFAVNLKGWLAELGLASHTETDRLIGDAVALSNALHESHARITALRTKLNTTLAAGSDAAVGEYAGLVDSGLEIAELWTRLLDVHHPGNVHLTGLIGELRRATRSLVAGNYAAAAIALYAVVDSASGRQLELPSTVKHLVSISTAIAEAESGDEIADVLEAYGAPVQSYRGKRAGGGYLAINAYLGASGGIERVSRVNDEFVGVSAPIGVELGRAAGKGWSVGLFAQLIDLGTLASFRLTASDDELKSEPEVGFAQVFSPGGYLIVGAPGVPVALGIGYNLAPSLRKLSDDPEEVRNARRWGAFLSIDMPLFRFK